MADITKGLPGLTFAGAISPNPGLAGRLQALREAGASYNDVYQDEPTRRFRRAMREVDDESALLSQMLNWRPSRNERVQAQRGFFLGSSPTEDIGLEAAAAGFGESRFDRRMASPAQLDDLEDARAREQSTLGVFGNSFAKMGVLAATTAADSWVGLPAGVINLIVEGASGNIHSGKDFLNALVDNPVSSYLQGINEKSEEIFRNYQTAEERNRPWWENMFTANFIGDTLIKNAGFTIGAVVGAKGAISAIGRMSGAKEARDAFKGLAAELGLAGKSASEVAESLAKGATTLEKEAAVKALAESARRLKNAELGLQIAGGLLAGTGEARIEALNGASELEKQYEDIYGNIDLERARALNRVRELMNERGIDYNTPEGRAYYEEQKAIIDANFIELQEQIAHDKAMAANTIFALNVPLLTFGDVMQWGKLMLGGYAIDRKLVKGIKKVAEGSVLRGATKLPENAAKATRYAAKGNKFTDILGKVKAGSRNVLVEMQEEMNQSLFSATAKAKAMGNTTEFMERLYDPMAVTDTVSWLDAAKEGMRQSWLNKDDWVEGFAGGFMGFMGLPSISVKVNEKTGENEKPGKKSLKLTMEGGIWTPIREQTDLYERRNKLIENLNARLSSPDFLNYYYGKIGNVHFDSIKEDAVKSGDKKAYERADHAQLINDIMMFEKAGRLQDFIDIVDSFQNVSDEKLEEIKKLFPSSSDVQSMTTSGMRELVNGNVEKIKRQLDGYLKIADNIRVVYGNMMPDEQVAEMTWQTAHLDEIEHDLKEILSHPSTASLLSAYRSENADSTSELSDYDIIASGAYDNWLKSKYKDKKDPTSKSDLKEAIIDANDARYDLKQRESYLSNIEDLSQDPELIQKRMALRMKQQERQRQMLKMAQSMVLLASTDKLSEFVSAVEDMDENMSNDVLAFIKNQADSGNQVAKEYLEIRDIDSHLKKRIEEIGKKAGATDEEIKQAMDAWNYFKHNSDTEFELTSKHSASDIASSVAGEKAVNLLNGAVEAVMKDLKIFGKVQKRNIEKKKKTTSSETDEEGNTKFKTTGKTLTKKRYDDICEELRENAKTNIFGVGAAIHRIDLDKGNFLFDGAPATGIIYIYFPNNNTHVGKGKLAVPVAFNSNGEEIAREDVEKITGPNGEEFTAWLLDINNFPVAGRRSYNIEAPGIAAKLVSRLPVDKKIAKKPKKNSKKEEDKDAGKKTKPHKFIAPNMDMALLGADGQAVAEVLKSLPEDAEVHFGMESEDGPIYILARDSNMKIGTLPEEVEGGESYSGLAELKELIKSEFKESGDKKNSNGMWISEKYVTNLREKQDSGFVTTEDNVPIDEIPGFDGIKEPILMFVYNDKDGQKYLFSNDSVDIDSIQFRAGASNQIKPGFAYLLVPSGKKFIPVMLYTQNINEETFDLKDPKNTASGFGKRVSDAIDKIVEAITNTNEKEKIRLFKLWAWNTATESDINSLQGLLHFRAKGRSRVDFRIKETCKAHPEWFTNDDVVMVINTHFEDSDGDDPIMIYRGKTHKDGSEYTIRDQIIDAMNSLEFETESGETHRGPIAQISAAQFTNDAENLPARIREFVESKMLLTDVKDFDLTMPSYILDYWSVSQGKFLRPSHPSGGGRSVSATVTTRKTKGKGTEKIASMEIGGKEIRFNLSTGEAKIGNGKWFSPMTSTKSIDAEIKKLGFKDTKSFVRTARALAIIADKYGDSTTGEGRIGDRILLKDFSAGKNAGFILTDNGGRFMNASELAKLEKDLKAGKSKKSGTKRANEAERVRKAKEEIEKQEDEPDNEDEFMQEVDNGQRFKKAQVSRMETIHNVRQAIEHLKKHAPQYAEFLDKISGIGFYDDVLVELADLTGRKSSRGGATTGTNTFKFNKKESEFTNSIVIGRNSLGYQTLMHELVHAFTVVALRYDKNLYEDIKSQMNYLQDSIGAARLARELGGYEAAYAFENPYEFIAEFFSNPKLQKLAKEVKSPEEIESGKTSIFARIINFIAEKLKSLFRKKGGSYYDDLKEKLYSVVDRQVELQETGKVVFKTQEEFKKSQRLAKGAKVDGVVFSSKIATVEDDMDFKFVEAMDDGFSGVRELLSFGDTSSDTNPGPVMLALSQLLNPEDEFNSTRGWNRLLENGSVYIYSNGSSSSLIGVKDGDIFISVRALPITSDGSFASLVKSVRNNSVPVIIGVNDSDVDFYTGLGMRVVGGKSSDGQVFVANPAFTDADLYKLGTTYRPFAEVLDGAASFTGLRRQRYSDSEWAKFSELERQHARKCIGI